MVALRIAVLLSAAAGTVQAAVFPRAGVCGGTDRGYIDAGTVCKPCGVNNRGNGNGGNGCSPCYIGGQLLVSTPYPAGVPFAADPAYPGGTGCFCNSDKGLFGGDKCKMCVGLGRVNGAFPSNACGRCITSAIHPKYIDPIDGSCKSIAGPCANLVTVRGNTIALTPSPASAAFFVEYPQGTTATACCQKCYSTSGCVGWVKPLTGDTEFGAAFAGGYCLLGMNTSPTLFSGKECGLEGSRIVTPSPASPARYEIQVGPCGRVATPTCGRDQVFAYPGGLGACTACSSLGRASLGIDNACGDCVSGATASTSGVCSCATDFEVHQNTCKACSTLAKTAIGQAGTCGGCAVTDAVADTATGVCGCASGFEERNGACVASCPTGSTFSSAESVCVCAAGSTLVAGACKTCTELSRLGSTVAGSCSNVCVNLEKQILIGDYCRTGLLTNPSFEVFVGNKGSTTGWTTTGPNYIVITGTYPFSFSDIRSYAYGYFAVRFTGSSSPPIYDPTTLCQTVTVDPSKQYKLSYYYKTVQGSIETVKVQVVGVAEFNVPTAVTPTLVYYQHDLTFSTATATVCIYFNSNGIYSQNVFDNVNLYPTS